MPFEIQIVVDSARPHEQADWWANALGWTAEPSDEAFVRQMIAEGYATEADTTTYKGVLVWKEGAAIRHPEPPLRRILFQWVPEGKTVKNRQHIDVRVGADNTDAEVARLTAAGASVLHTGAQGPHHWVTMADPEGNEFCVS